MLHSPTARCMCAPCPSKQSNSRKSPPQTFYRRLRLESTLSTSSRFLERMKPFFALIELDHAMLATVRVFRAEYQLSPRVRKAERLVEPNGPTRPNRFCFSLQQISVPHNISMNAASTKKPSRSDMLYYSRHVNIRVLPRLKRS
ncbi:unnamed protein product [Periconia digitata]|uniref:Uncharacterized protein n=1 Tax=Periconia digitata TaxID=1303443 RepID=A0A9W4XWW7_9PLEO|nr:unnamed protein product [Periconia digitata]